jgi:hypothetical protein
LDPQLLDPLIAAQLSGNELRRRVAKAVGTVTHEAERRYWDVEVGSRFNPEQMADGWRDRLTRWEFEQAFPHCLASGRVIEFSDGMRTIPELIDAIPQNFSGLLDLTVCNSVVPAGAIRTRRPNCLIAANRRPAELRSRIYLYGLEIRLLAKRPIPFTEAIKQVHSGRSTYQVKDENIWTLLRKLFGSTT